MKMYKLSNVPTEFQMKVVEDFKAQSYDSIWEFMYDVDQKTVYAGSKDSWLELHRKKKTGVWCISISEESFRELLKS